MVNKILKRGTIMKKRFKLAISIMACGLMLLTGCGTSSASLPSELIGQTNKNPDTINVMAPSFFSNADDKNVESEKQQWLDEMSQRYGVNFNITSSINKDGTYDFSVLSQISDIVNGKTQFSGLVNISSINNLKIAIESGVALPLENYLADNPVWNSLPDEIKRAFEIDGHIYAIPTFVTQMLNARIIHNEALQQTGITVTDLESFKQFAVSYAELTGKPAVTSYKLWDCDDILNAFGLYTGISVNKQFGYDPTEGSIVDFLTKDSSVEALGYLRELYNAGAFRMDFDNLNASHDNFTDETSASIYEIYSTNLDNCSKIITFNSLCPQVLENFTSGFIMTNETPQPKETIDLFVNMLFGSEQNYLECWLGSSNNYIINSDGTITVKMVQNKDGSYVFPAIPDLTGGLADVFPYSEAKIVYSQDGVITNDSKSTAGRENEYYNTMYDSLEKGTTVKISPVYTMINSVSYYADQKIQNDVIYLYEKCIKDAITGTESVQQIIEIYRDEMYKLGGNQMLDEMNAAIGKTTAYYYG